MFYILSIRESYYRTFDNILFPKYPTADESWHFFKTFEFFFRDSTNNQVIS